MNLLFQSPIENELRVRHVRGVEQLKKAIYRVARREIRELRALHLELCTSVLLREPFHLRSISRRLFGDDNVNAFSLAKNGFETAQHPVRTSNKTNGPLMTWPLGVRTLNFEL